MTAPVRPAPPVVRRGVCELCDAPGRPYLGGWKCDTHKPRTRLVGGDR